MTFNRREFLKAASAAGCLMPMTGVQSLAWAQSSSNGPNSKSPLLITIFLRGGADGLNLVSPVNDEDFISARPPELRVVESGNRAGFLLPQSHTSDIGFYLHNEAAPLADLYNAKRLAVIHAIGIPDGTRSHEEAQSLLERGTGSFKHDNKSLQTPGWMARSVDNSIAVSQSIPAYSASTITPLSLEGISTALITPDLNAGLNVPWGKPTFDLLETMTQGHGNFMPKSSSSISRAMADSLLMQNNINRSIARDPSGKVLPYLASGTANYDGAGELSRSLSSIARLAKMEVGLQIANVNFGGWDTHESQTGQFANVVRQLSKGLAAFQNDMESSNQAITVIVMTEFGRRVRSNKSNGTDHGHGACWFVLGTKVNGGNLYGNWPGLKSQEMDQGLDLAVTTDYRQALTEAIQASGLNADKALLGWKPKVSPLNLFS